MARENVEIVRAAYEALNREDWDAAFRVADPDFEVTFQRGPFQGTYRGREKLQAILNDQRQAFDAWIMEPIELLESGDQIVAIVISRLRPKDTEAEIELRNGHLWTVREGTLISLVGFPDPDDALRSAGIRR